ncbi:PAS domain-containing sensor histidine kinase [Pseudomonas syringae]|uniref:histidine kinase n=3 Tax=Pseudomonas TaxID=286 RepID=F3FN64_PSESX|nr:PAS/PAC sensor hybrid histidine kinase [Pseudomonas syringae pv. japonica str. M301072]KWS27184.1 PAS domain-containing sensor histidine kinase [Pseudomonas syringae pv. syringae]MBI6764028.1 PAS domain-containing sensor histidine kinase [Pseudomonas syringae]MBI6786416.1 PAS domain-containing sensor histidine kinase [Pseudomonas syringae]MCF5551420.1 PAS domain-containing sensor histidine kinase [Pseudomonas syringae]
MQVGHPAACFSTHRYTMALNSDRRITQGPWNARYSQDLIEHLPVGLYICDRNAVVVAYNLKAAEIWGETPVKGDPEVKFCGAHRLYAGDGTYLPHDQTPMVQVLATGEPALNVDVIVERRDGSRRNVIANVTPLFDEGGDQIGFVNCVQDVTFLRQREEERVQMISDRFQAQKMEIVGQLTAGIAHDFNNMLTAVTGSASLAEHYLKNDKPDHAKKHLANALRASQTASAMTARLMAFSRRHKLGSEVINVNPLITSLIELGRGSLGSKVLYETDLASNLWLTKVDPHQLESAVFNLMVNARDAMPAGGTISIRTSNVDVSEQMAAKGSLLVTGQSCVRIQVSDTGTGMPVALIERIFEPFFTTKEEGKGTGLGLTMVYGYVNQAGGCLTVESQEGHGTTFSLFMPRDVLPEVDAVI